MNGLERQLKAKYDVFQWIGEDSWDGWELYAENCTAREAVWYIRQLELQGYDRDVSIFVERRESDVKTQKSFV